MRVFLERLIHDGIIPRPWEFGILEVDVLRAFTKWAQWALPCWQLVWTNRVLYSIFLVAKSKAPIHCWKLPPNQQSGPYHVYSVLMPRSPVSINLILHAFSISDTLVLSVLLRKCVPLNMIVWIPFKILDLQKYMSKYNFIRVFLSITVPGSKSCNFLLLHSSQ